MPKTTPRPPAPCYYTRSGRPEPFGGPTRCTVVPDDASAYCADHQPKAPYWYVELKGRKQCQCNGCHEVFSTPRWFDLHQTLRDGKLTCKDPRRMFRKSDHRRIFVLTVRGWARNPDLNEFDTFDRKERNAEDD